ncbi:MAG: acyl-CoA/acyl-ACP dehydrogenase [Candidatus Yanofskybacteria bacterium]|nr:acyl-CoA/acyl-ACP dehydrogenase [Candidatus Yanofskybacteria bacterium]
MAGKGLREIEKLLKLAASFEGKPSFAMKLALGHYDERSLYDFEVEDTNTDTFNELSSWLNKYLTDNVDPVQIHRDSKVPKSVFDILSRRLLGVKIKKEYGGLELTTLQYCLLMRILAGNSSPLGIWFTANCSIGLSGYLMVVYDSLKKELKETSDSAKRKEVEGLIIKTEWQMKEFLPKLAAGANAGFGLTQQEAGSDPMAMIGTDTVAEKITDGMFRVRGHKLYNTGGTIAEYEVIMAPLLPHNSICTFIVPTSRYGQFKVTPCDFEGNRGIENGFIQFDVKVPESFLIGRETGHDGLKNAFRTLNVGRLAMSAGSSATIVNCLQISRWWSKVRVQGGRPIGKYMKVAHRVARMATDAFAVEAIMDLGSSVYDRHKSDTDLRLETAAIKLWSTERAYASAEANDEVRSGQGYETYESQARRARLIKPHVIPLPDNTFLSDAKVLRVGEGTTDIQQLIITSMIFAPHALRLMPILDFKKNPLKAVKAVFSAVPYYTVWVSARMAHMLSYWITETVFSALDFLARLSFALVRVFIWGSDLILKEFNSEPVLLEKDNYVSLRPHKRYIKYASKKLALKSLWLMFRHGTKLLKEQVVTSFLANQLTELWVMSAVCWYADQLYPKHGNLVDQIADIHCGYARARINGNSENKPCPLVDAKAYDLAQKIIFEDASAFLENGFTTVLDRELNRWGGN